MPNHKNKNIQKLLIVIFDNGIGKKRKILILLLFVIQDELEDEDND